MPILRRDDTPKGDPAPPAEGLTMLPARPDLVLMIDEKLRLLGRRDRVSRTEIDDMLLDLRGAANRDVIA